MFDIPKQGEPLPEEKPQKTQKEKAPRVKPKNDPRLVAAARELRGRWLERVNADTSALLAQGKYDVSRQIEERSAMTSRKPTPLLAESVAA